ncbi:MAG: patatin-like phospholipase family protein [Bacillota bacterium]|jgi:NTE family protein
MRKRLKLGLALGGGFLRGTAHIGFIDVLEREGIEVDLIAGASAGSIVAALYAQGGLSPAEMEKTALGLTARDVFDMCPTVGNLLLVGGKVVADVFRLPFPFRSPLGLMKGDRLERLVNQWVGQTRTFAQLQKSLAIVSVDVNTGTLVVFLAGGFLSRTVIPPEDKIFIEGVTVARAVRASCAVPGMFEPVAMGRRLLVDGGIRNNVPADIVRQMGADVVVAVDVGYDGNTCKNVASMTELLSQSLDIMGTEGVTHRLDKFADVVVRPVIKNVSPWDFNQIEYCIGQGRRAGSEAVPAIRRALGL